LLFDAAVIVCSSSSHLRARRDLARLWICALLLAWRWTAIITLGDVSIVVVSYGELLLLLLRVHA